MKVCFPVASDAGLNSPVYGHFGSAPLFLVVDSSTQEIQTLNNGDREHVHGQCSPLRALGSATVDAIVVGGIGGGALQGLNRMGLKVYRAQAPTIAGNLQLLAQAQLSEVTPGQTCSGHSHGGGCGHH